MHLLREFPKQELHQGVYFKGLYQELKIEQNNINRYIQNFLRATGISENNLALGFNFATQGGNTFNYKAY